MSKNKRNNKFDTTDHFWGNFVRTNLLQLFTLSVGAIMAFALLYFTSIVTPLVINISKIENKTEVLAKEVDKNTQAREQMIIISTNVENIMIDIRDIQKDIKSLLIK